MLIAAIGGRICLWHPGSDLLLLNSDTEVTSGFIEEMQAVIDLHEKHAVVTPRSNNATIFSVPQQGERLDPKLRITCGSVFAISCRDTK